MPGLDYIIDASYTGEDEVKRFRADIAALKKDLAAVAAAAKSLGGLRQIRALSRARSNAAKTEAAAQKTKEQATKSASKEEEKLAKRTLASQREQARQAKQAASLLQRTQRVAQAGQDKLERTRKRDFKSQLTDLNRKNKEVRRGIADDVSQVRVDDERRLNDLLRQANAIRAQGNKLTRAGAANLKRLEASRNRINKLEVRAIRNAERLKNAGSSAIGPFTRLFRVMIAYAGVRAIFQGISTALRSAVGTAKALEDALLGTASVLTAVGTIVDEDGPLSGFDALNAVTSLAKEQLDQLRLAGLRTGATFKQLADTFQVAVGPGIRAGLSLDFIRQFTVSISQAASAIGLAQDQLNEEIRSILQGTINVRFTRIAAVLGITNEDIKRAKELGNLAEFLQTRFDAFRFSGERALQNFTQIVSNLQDALQLIGAEGVSGLFNELKEGALGLQQSLVNVEDDAVILSPDAVDIVRNLTQFLALAVSEARKLGDSIGVEGFLLLSRVFRDISSLLISVIAPALRLFSEAAVVSSKAFLSVKSTVGDIAEALDTVSLDLIKGILVTLVKVRLAATAFVVSLSAASKVVGAIGGFLGGSVAAGLSKATIGAAALTRVFRRMLLPILAIGFVIDEIASRIPNFRSNLEKAILGAANLFNIVSDETLSTFLEFGDFDDTNFRPFQEGLVAALKTIADQFNDVFKEQTENTDEADRTTAAVGNISDALRKLITPARAFQEELRKAQAEVESANLESAFGGDLSDLSKLFTEVNKRVFEFNQNTQLSTTRLDQIRGALVNLEGARDRALAAGEQAKANRLTALGIALTEEQAGIEADLADLRQQELQRLNQQLRLFKAQNAERAKSRALEAQINAARDRRILEVDPGARDASAQAAIIERDAEIQTQLVTIAETNALLERQRIIIEALKRTSAELGEGREDQIALLDIEQQKRNQILATLAEQEAALARRAQEQARQQQIEGNFGIAFLRGIQDSAASVSEIFLGLGNSFGEAIRGSLEQGVAAAFAGELTSDSFRDWATRVSEDLQVKLVAAIIDAFVISPVLDVLGGLFKADPIAITVTQANTTAVTILTTAISALTAAVLGQTTVAFVPTAGLPSGPSGPSFGGAEGGLVGSAAPSAKAPPGFDHRDKIHAMVREKEYISTPEMDKRNPGLFRFLEHLRKGGRIGRMAMENLPNFNSPKRNPSRMYGFAHGGAVGSIGSGSNASFSSESGAGGTIVYQPVLITDSAEMDKLIAAQRDAILALVSGNPEVYRNI